MEWWLCCAFRCLQAWQRPTLPRLETKYHWRWGFSRPSSGWDRVFGPPPWPPGRRASERRILRLPRLRGWSFRDRCLAAAMSGGCRGGVFQSGSEEPVWVPNLPPKRKMERVRADRAISTGKLHALPRFHIRPIDVIVYHGSRGIPGFEGGFPLRCFQRLSRPYIATRRCRWHDNRYTRGTFTPVLSY